MLKCGLLGRKLGHSYSPAIHGMLSDYSYQLFEREPEELEDPDAQALTASLADWFEDTFSQQFGGCSCREILEGDPGNKMRRCPEIVEAVYLKCGELLQEKGIPL